MNEKKYYLQNPRQMSGNFLLFRKKGHQKYTTNLNEAMKFTLEEALNEPDILWPVKETKNMAQLQINYQNLPHGYKEEQKKITWALKIAAATADFTDVINKSLQQKPSKTPHKRLPKTQDPL